MDENAEQENDKFWSTFNLVDCSIATICKTCDLRLTNFMKLPLSSSLREYKNLVKVTITGASQKNNNILRSEENLVKSTLHQLEYELWERNARCRSDIHTTTKLLQ